MHKNLLLAPTHQRQQLLKQLFHYTTIIALKQLQEVMLAPKT